MRDRPPPDFRPKRREEVNSALDGHVDFVDLAERVSQGILVEKTAEPSSPVQRRSSPIGHHRKIYTRSSK
jgi:hypothetical protein